MTSSSFDMLSLIQPSDRRALVDPDDGRVLSAEQLHEQIDRLAARLVGAGVRPGGVVGIVHEHGVGGVLAFLAIVRCNAVAMPLSPQLHPHEMTALLGPHRPAAMLVGGEGVQQGVTAAADLGVRALAPLDDHRPDATSGDGRPLPDGDPDAVALLLHTSGTTGRPKSVPLRQRHLAASARSIADGYGLGRDDASYCVMPLFHVHGLVASTLAALAAGGAVIVPRRVRPRAVWQHAIEHDASWLSAVPTILAKLPELPQAGVPTLRFVRSCSSSLSPTLWSKLEQRIGVPIIEAYGMTEASHQMTTNPLPPEQRRPGTVGVSAGAAVKIVDQQWRSLPPGHAGEVAVNGPGVVDGYLDNPDANAASFRDGWFRTGDLGRLSDDGYLTLEGRLKEMINRGGEKIAPREIDEALLAHGAVLEAVAFGRADDKWGEVVEAVVVLREPVEPGLLRDHCAELLAPFKVPRTVHVVDAIPKGPTGKVQRRLIPDQLDT